MLWWASVAVAGLGPMDTMVVYNADVPEAQEVATAYQTARSLPASHRCGLTGIDPAATSIDFESFDTNVREPLEACLAGLPDPDGIDVLVTVRGLPYLVDLSSGRVGFEAALQLLRAVDRRGDEIVGSPGSASAEVLNPTYVGGAPCVGSDLVETNPFADWYRSTCTLTRAARLPRSFERSRPLEAGTWDFTGNLFIVGRLDGFDYDDALALVERGVQADGTFPDGTLLCMHAADDARGARDPECEYLIRRLDEIGANAAWLPEFDGALKGQELAGLFTGAASFRDGIDGNTWQPGAIACNLTSFGAVPNNFFCDAAGKTCPERESQTSIARFIRAGATGAHGTVAEPLNNSFPDASTLLLYHEGYTMGEAFLFSSQFLYWYNLVLGDPLTAPYAHRPEITVTGVPTMDAPLVLQADHPDGIASLELFVDGASVAAVEGGDTLSFDPELPEGETLSFLAVATADLALVGRAAFDDGVRPPTGWDVPDGEQRVRAEPKGWLVDSVTVEATPDPQSECGCASTLPMGAWSLVPLGLLTFHRRRRAR